jgi:hypothetical protein
MVHYRYHARFGEQVVILRRFNGTHQLVQLSNDVRLAIPAWMLDPVACAQLSDASHPRISVSALLTLRRLIDEPLRNGNTPAQQGDDHEPKRDGASTSAAGVRIRAD